MALCISEGATRLIVDCPKLNYVSSAGLRALVVAAQAVKSKGGDLSCCALSGVVRKVFEITGFTALPPGYETVEDALNKE